MQAPLLRIDTGRLSNREAEIVAEVEKALSLLREEGSSVAMPEAVQQVRDDMLQLVQRLAEGKTEVLTQAIETDVIKALEEIVDAFKKAQKEAKKKPPGPSPNGQPQDPPLIEQLAELKMIAPCNYGSTAAPSVIRSLSWASRPTGKTFKRRCSGSASKRQRVRKGHARLGVGKEPVIEWEDE